LGNVDERVEVLGLAVELDQFAAEVLTDRPHDRLHPVQVMAVNTGAGTSSRKPSGHATQIRGVGLYERPYLVA
jgi:hypothetical protein